MGGGRGGRTGEEPPSKVELVENAGDAGGSDAFRLPSPPSASKEGGADESNEDVFAAGSQSAQGARLV